MEEVSEEFGDIFDYTENGAGGGDREVYAGEVEKYFTDFMQ